MSLTAVYSTFRLVVPLVLFPLSSALFLVALSRSVRTNPSSGTLTISQCSSQCWVIALYNSSLFQSTSECWWGAHPCVKLRYHWSGDFWANSTACSLNPRKSKSKCSSSLTLVKLNVACELNVLLKESSNYSLKNDLFHLFLNHLPTPTLICLLSSIFSQPNQDTTRVVWNSKCYFCHTRKSTSFIWIILPRCLEKISYLSLLDKTRN